MNDPRLFDDRPVPEGDPMQAVPNSRTPTGKSHKWTSHVAAAKAAPRAGTHAAIVLGFIESRGFDGATDDEVRYSEECADIPPGNITPRRRGLVLDGFVVDSGRVRLSQRGCPSTVWIHVRFKGGG